MAERGISRIKFAPAARPVDTVGVDTTFQRMAAPMQRATESLAPVMDRMPEAPWQNNKAAQLIEAMSGFTKVVSQIGEQYDKQKADDERLQAEYDAQTSSAKTWEEAVRDKPELAMKSPFYRNTFLARTATNAMMAKFGQLQAEYYQSPLVNSTDPVEVNKWLQERLQSDLDKITDQAGREAALKFIRERSATFMNAHQSNATQNLIKKRQESFGAGYTATLDESGALPVAKAYEVGQVFARDLPPEAQAFLSGLSAGESAGQYNVRFNGGKGAIFDTNAPHPNIREAIPWKKGEYSSASGKYQFIYGTWVAANGGENKPMTEENQDRAAWAHAQKTYKENTGKDLLDDLKTQGLTQGIMRSLGGQWEAWKKGGRDDLARYAATYNTALQNRGGRVPENAAGKDPNFNALTAKLWDNHEAQVAGGEKIETADKDLVQSVVNKVMETQDTSYLKILDVSRGGRPPLSKDPTYSKVVFDTIRQAEALKVERQNAQGRMQEKQKKLLIDQKTSELFGQSVERIKQGQDPSYSWDTIAAAYKVDPDLGEKLTRLNKVFEEGQTREDPREINTLWNGIYSGKITKEDLFSAQLDGA
jgi:muramidase (phage lysozyme)